MTKLEIKLKNKIMRRVYAVWFLKKILSLSFLRSIITLGLFVELAREVSLVNVFNNLPELTDLSANYRYFTYAFTHTEVSVQAYLMVITAMTAWFAFHQLTKIIPNTSLDRFDQ